MPVNQRMRRRAVALALALMAGAMGPTGRAVSASGPLGELVDPGWDVPNLVPAVTFVEVGYWYEQDPDGNIIQSPPNIRFSVSVRNVGEYPMDFLGDPSEDPVNDIAEPNVQQCVSWTEKVCRERRQVGGFMWHAEHKHFHFQDFATYELRRLRAPGKVDWRERGLLQIAPKVSFCLMDTQPSRPDSPPPFYTVCLTANQGISPGWEDVYANFLDGQGLSIEGLPDGQYALAVRLDPNNRLYETDDTDNLTALVVEIHGNGTQARIVGPAN